MTAVVLINAGLVAVNSNFCTEFSVREMKQHFLASDLTLFSCQKTVSLSFKPEKTKANVQKITPTAWMVIARTVCRTVGFCPRQQPRELEVWGKMKYLAEVFVEIKRKN